MQHIKSRDFIFPWQAAQLLDYTRLVIALTKHCNEHPGNRTIKGEKWSLPGYTLFFILIKHIDCE